LLDGEDKKDSDIDIIIITSNINNDLKIEDEIYGKTFETLLETGEYLSVKMVGSEHVNTIKSIVIFLFIEILKKMIFQWG